MINFEIKLPLFEGPFDLLLFFIERDEIDIYDIPISTITNDFLAYLQQLESMNIEVASEFILVAATLMRIKAKMLLPRPKIDETGKEIDPREELVNHLLAYKQYKIAAQQMAVFEENRLLCEQRGNIAEEVKNLLAKADNEAELLDLDMYKLLKVYQKVMSRFAQNSNKYVHQIIPFPYSIEGQRNFILDLLLQKEIISFLDIVKICYNNQENKQNNKQINTNEYGKIIMIFNFLAILDLLQASKIRLLEVSGVNDFSIGKATNTITEGQNVLENN